VISAEDPTSDHLQVQQDRERARRLRRELAMLEVNGDVGAGVVRLARDGAYDLIVLPLPADLPADSHRPLDARSAYILRHAHCPAAPTALSPWPARRSFPTNSLIPRRHPRRNCGHVDVRM